MIYLLALLATQAQRYELVVRFPGNEMGYNHVYRNKDACDAAREIVVNDYRNRVADQVRQYGYNYVPGPAPTALCLPV